MRVGRGRVEFPDYDDLQAICAPGGGGGLAAQNDLSMGHASYLDTGYLDTGYLDTGWLAGVGPLSVLAW